MLGATRLLLGAIPRQMALRSLQMSTLATKFEVLALSQPAPYVVRVDLNRPDKMNALSNKLWHELADCFDKLSSDPDCRCVILSGAGKHFCAGIDLMEFKGFFDKLAELPDHARRAFALREYIKNFQDNLSSIEKCRKPVIAAIHGRCIGAGIDMIASTDVRYCSNDAIFHIKEVEVGLAPDTGTIERFSKSVGNISAFNEMVLSAQQFDSGTALQMGMVSRVFPDRSAMNASAETLAKSIASKSPVAVQTAKAQLIYSRDHSVADSLHHIANWNATALQSDDLIKSVMAVVTKQAAEFDKL